ncbi:polysaccharide biosynthesis protein [Desulfoferula mesophila]|uniref:Polysaccharide biosynthesis protein n=2 Tax=Desulfoferula mesophila TaxID=3058419 RepID=A0AAU9ESE5_9BACT|nr:polysaccharide biosynthesis protein [Desulfoferula mesophilus]
MTRRILLRLFLSAPLSLATLVYLPILTRTLGKAQYGEWGLAMSVVTGVSAVATMGLAVVIPRFYAQDREQGTFAQRFWSCLLFALVMAAAQYAVAWLFADPLGSVIFNSAGGGPLSRASVFLGIALSMRTFLSSLLRARFELVRQSILELAITAARTAAILGLALWGASVRELLWSQSLIEFSACVYLTLAAWRRVPLQGAKLTLPKTYFYYALPLLPAVALTWLGKNIERFVLVHLQGQAMVGEYTVAFTVSSVLVTFSAAVNFVLLPQLAQAWTREDRREQSAKLFATANRNLLLLGLPVIVGLALVWSDLVVFLTGRAFGVTWPVAALAAAGHLSSALYLANVYALHLQLRTKLILPLLASGVCLSVALSFGMIPSLGILGAATAFWAGQTINAMIAMGISRRLTGWSLPLNFFLRAGGACLAMGCLVAAAKGLGHFNLWALIALGVAVYAASTLCLGLITMGQVKGFWGRLGPKAG